MSDVGSPSAAKKAPQAGDVSGAVGTERDGVGRKRGKPFPRSDSWQHLGCRSYPECDEDPGGCVLLGWDGE